MEQRHNDEIIIEKLEGLKLILEERLSSVHTLFNQKFEQNYHEHKKMIERQDIANSRTSKLENFKNTAQGAFLVINVFVVPILLWLIYEQIR